MSLTPDLRVALAAGLARLLQNVPEHDYETAMASSLAAFALLVNQFGLSREEADAQLRAFAIETEKSFCDITGETFDEPAVLAATLPAKSKSKH